MGFTAILAYAEGLPVRHHPHSRFMIRISLITITICSALLSDNRIGYALPDSPTADVIKELTSWAGQSESARPRLADQEFAKTPLNKAQAKQASAILVKDFRNQLASQRKKEWAEKIIRLDKLEMKFDYRVFGEKPKTGRRLFISMHGGGGTTANINDQQWRNQIRLYEPKEGVYLAPRAPTNTWNLWHQGHIDDFFTRIIENAILFADVNPNQVYIMGYSAGGDGVYQLAPRMADQLAAAAMMAGHPNNASPLGLRNIGFTLHMGGLDKAYNRNGIARQWKQKLADLQDNDTQGYRHKVTIHEKHGHWMNRDDRVAVPWMSKFSRDPLPEKIVWFQSGRTHQRFYWLAVDEKNRVGGSQISVSMTGKKTSQTTGDSPASAAQFKIDKADKIKSLTIRLNDHFVDLDQPITVVLPSGKKLTQKARRTIGGLYRSLSERFDPESIFSAEINVPLE
jgi:predicted esterase